MQPHAFNMLHASLEPNPFDLRRIQPCGPPCEDPEDFDFRVSEDIPIPDPRLLRYERAQTRLTLRRAVRLAEQRHWQDRKAANRMLHHARVAVRLLEAMGLRHIDEVTPYHVSKLTEARRVA